MNLFKYFIFTLLTFGFTLEASKYPTHWWTKTVFKVDEKKPSWEILPEAGKKNETVILSKRHELGLLSNFAHTPFTYEGKTYQSVEGLWQSMKYPENTDDKRNHSKVKWKYKRSEVEKMTAFKAKKAGDLASENMKLLKVDWVTYKGAKMTYRELTKGPFYKVIYGALVAKVIQNKNVKDALISTGNLELLPDHITNPKAPPAWKYHDIWMEIRSKIQNGSKL